jgi:DNA-binding MarR family transcriptional regulator
MKNSIAVKNIRAFNRFYTNILGLVDRHILHSPFSLTEARILYEVFHDPGCTVRKIRNILQVDEGYLSRTINKLLRQGLLIKEQSQNDGRVFILSLTRKGKDEFLKLNNESEISVESMISHLTQEEIKEIESSMDRIQELLNRKG